MLESINKVEIQGRVGAVRANDLAETSFARMSVATSHVYKGTDGVVVEEVTWHNIILWEGKAASKEVIHSIAKGDAVHVIGRIKQQRYTDSNGNEKSFTEIFAYQFEKVEA